MGTEGAQESRRVAATDALSAELWSFSDGSLAARSVRSAEPRDGAHTAESGAVHTAVGSAVRPQTVGHSDGVLLDYDFHPDEDSTRVFRTPQPGILRLDEELAVTEVAYDNVVLRHYAFAKHWFKINVTTDTYGDLIETGDEANRFAFNCDIATPMEREGNCIYAVDLFVDVLIRRDASSFHVGDEDEFIDMAAQNVLSRGEQRASRAALSELVDSIETGRLLPWLNHLVPFGPCDPPAAPPMERVEIPERMKPHVRSSW